MSAVNLNSNLERFGGKLFSPGSEFSTYFENSGDGEETQQKKCQHRLNKYETFKTRIPKINFKCVTMEV